MINFPRSILEHGSTFPRVVNGLISLWDDHFGTLRTCAVGGESVQRVKGKSVCVSMFKLLSLLQVIFIYHLWYVFSLFTISAVIFLSNINFSSFVYYFLIFHICYYVICFSLKLFSPSTVKANFKNNERKNGKHVFMGYFTKYWSRT